MNIEVTKKEQQFISAYLACIDFTDTGDTDQPESGAELCTEFLRESIIDCLAFYSRIAVYISDDHIEQAGHDFWLTRNRHGAGFWCRPEIWGVYEGEKFTKIAESFGEVNSFFENEVKQS